MSEMQSINYDTDLPAAPSIKGNLTQVHPGKLLYGFFKAKKSGVLEFDDGSVSFRLFLHDGCLYPFEAGIFGQRDFAKLLIGFGLLAKEEFESHARRARELGIGTVQFLIEQQTLEKAQMIRVANIFFERHVFGLFSWRDGDYAYYEQELPIDTQPSRLTTLRWIIDGIRKQYHPGMIEDRLRKRLNSPLKVFTDAPIQLDELLVTENERAIADAIAEGKTLAEIINGSAADSADVRGLVFGLLTIECVKFGREAGAKEKARQKQKSKPASAPGTAEERLAAAFREAEVSVERIRDEVAREPDPPLEVARSEPAGESPRRKVGVKLSAAVLRRAAEFGVNLSDLTGAENADDLAALLRRRIQEKIEGLHQGHAAAASSKQAAPVEDELAAADESTEVPLEEMGKFDLGELPELDAARDGSDMDLGLDGLDDLLADGPAARKKRVGFDRDFEPPDDNVPPEMQDDLVLEGPDFSDSDPPDQVFRMGLALLEQEEWERGYEAINFAHERGFVDPALNTYLGWAYYNTHVEDPDRLDKAAKIVRRTLDANQRDTNAYLILGRMFLSEGDGSMAELYFVRALEVDPECGAAKDYIREIYSGR